MKLPYFLPVIQRWVMSIHQCMICHRIFKHEAHSKFLCGERCRLEFMARAEDAKMDSRPVEPISGRPLRVPKI